MLVSNSAYRYETAYNGPFLITHRWTNYTVTLQCGGKKLGIIYIVLSHIHLIQIMKILTLKNMHDDIQYMITSCILLYYIKACILGI